jgi:hypothetical protein
MRVIIVVALVMVAVVSVFGGSQLLNQAGAAPPPPQPQPVREQNLDSSGFIRVHEQGTANVNVVSMPSAP